MKYNKFGKTGIELSALGFGAMRLPMKKSDDGKSEHVDFDLTVPMLQKAFELGVNYVDTAQFYCNKDSEIAVGQALKGWRDRVYLSTKIAIQDDSYDNYFKALETSLKKLDTDHIDFYHMHGINLKTFTEVIDKKGGPIDAAKKALDEGLIKFLSFSFHDAPENIKPIIDSGYYSSVLMSYNFFDRSNEDGLAYARDKGLGTVVMNPVGGGRLGVASDDIKGLLGDKKRVSTVELSLRYVLTNPNVDVALSGMGSLKMLEENVKVASQDAQLSDSERAQIEVMMQENKRLAELYCTGCKYCLPCPQGINIPHIFTLMNYDRVYNLGAYARQEYKNLYIDMEQRAQPWEKEWGVDASKCNECGSCEEKCPQKLKIKDQLKETHAVIG